MREGVTTHAGPALDAWDDWGGTMRAADDRARRRAVLDALPASPPERGRLDDSPLWTPIFLALNAMDTRDLSDRTRQLCVDDLETALADVGEDVAAVLFTRPLPPTFSVDAGLALSLGPRTRSLLEELRRMQPSVAAVWAAWSRVPERHLCGADRELLTATLARSRWFLGLVRAHAAGATTGAAREPAECSAYGGEQRVHADYGCAAPGCGGGKL